MGEFIYTVPYVEQMLEAYPYIREGMGQPPRQEAVVYLEEGKQPMPFHEKKHAVVKRDGKKRARQNEDTWCAIFDIEMAFPQLSAESRSILTLVTISGFTHAEAASRLGLSESSVKLRVRAALDQLCKILNGE